MKIWMPDEVLELPRGYDDVAVGEYVMFLEDHVLTLVRREPVGWSSVNPDHTHGVPFSEEELAYLRQSLGLDPEEEL